MATQNSSAEKVFVVEAKVQVGLNLIAIGSKPVEDGQPQPKTMCPVTVDQFIDGARPVQIQIGGTVLEGEVKIFSTGSFGWYTNGKAKAKVRATSVVRQDEGSERTVCPVSADDFVRYPVGLNVSINGVTLEGTPKMFSTGSYGWNVHGKVKIMVDGEEVRCQVTGNITLIGSKPTE